MKWFGNRRGEGHEVENTDVKPKNQITQTPEKQTFAEKMKLDNDKLKPIRKQEGSSNASAEGDASKGQLEREFTKKLKPMDRDER